MKYIFRLLYEIWGIIAPFFLKFFVKDRYDKITTEKNIKIWIHASSIGELNIVENILPYLCDSCGDDEFLISTFTYSGFKQAKNRYKNVILFPVGSACYYRNIIKKYSVAKLYIMETEIWPVLLDICARQNVDVYFVNFYISQRSFGSYKKLFKFIPFIKDSIKMILTKDDQTAKRAEEIGLPNIIKGSDLKFKYNICESGKDNLRKKFNIKLNDRIVIFVSLRENEESVWIDSMDIVDKVIVAPRHFEKSFDKLVQYCKEKNVTYKLYSDFIIDNKFDTDMIIVDKFGVLSNMYKISDISVVGGTFFDVGGHNILEPVRYNIPVVYGKSVYKQKQADGFLMRYKAGIKVSNISDISSVLGLLFSDVRKYNEICENQKIMISRINADFDSTIEKLVCCKKNY